MKKLFFKYLLLISCISLFISCSSTQEIPNTWISPSYKAEAYKKIVVLVKITDPTARRIMEDAMVKELNNKNYHAINSYSNFSENDLENEEKLIEKANALGIDALLLFSDPNLTTQYKQKPVVTANVGVPVNIGFMNVYLGTGIPLGGGNSKKEIVSLKSSFYNKSSRDPQWTLILSGEYKGNSIPVANEFAIKTITNLFKSKVLL